MTDPDPPAQDVFRKSTAPSPPAPPSRVRFLVPALLAASFLGLAALSLWTGVAGGRTDPVTEEVARLATDPTAERWVFHAGEAAVGVAIHDPRDSTLLVWVRGLPQVHAGLTRSLWSVRKDDPARPRRVAHLSASSGDRPDLVARDVPSLDAYEGLLVSEDPDANATEPTTVVARASRGAR